MADSRQSPHNESMTCSAFHGDHRTADFFLNRLQWHARAGHLELSRLPLWSAGRGSISASFVHDVNPQIFEQMTGLSYSFGLILDFTDARSITEIGEVVAAIPLGVDTRFVAVRVLISWFSDVANCWPELLGDAQVDQLRRDWVNTCIDWLERHLEPDWQNISVRAARLMQPESPLRAVQNSMLRIFQSLSPPPPPHEHEAWLELMADISIHSKFSVAQHSLGWTASDFAKEEELFHWFNRRQKSEPGGKFNEKTLRAAQEEWEALPKDPEYIGKEEYFHFHREEIFKPINARIRGLVLKHLGDMESSAETRSVGT